MEPTMKRTSLLSLALAIPLAATATGCGSDDGGGGAEGDHYQYVVAKLDTRATNKLDIDGNGVSDNKFGDLIGLLLLGGLDVQPAVDEAVITGAAVLLADIQATSLSAAANAGISIYLGDSANITPAPCTDKTMLATCGQHLKGTGNFAIAAGAPRDTLLTGSIAGGTLKAGPGNIALQLAITGSPIAVKLIGARAQASEISADGIVKGIVGGAISETEINDNLLPAIEAQIEFVVNRDCGPKATRTCAAQTDCKGVESTLGILGLFDKAPMDCAVTVSEIKAILANNLASDVTVDGQKGLSVGLGFTAKKATFAP
jgi:hypothetical protein